MAFLVDATHKKTKRSLLGFRPAHTNTHAVEKKNPDRIKTLCSIFWFAFLYLRVKNRSPMLVSRSMPHQPHESIWWTRKKESIISFIVFSPGITYSWKPTNQKRYVNMWWIRTRLSRILKYILRFINICWTWCEERRGRWDWSKGEFFWVRGEGKCSVGSFSPVFFLLLVGLVVVAGAEHWIGNWMTFIGKMFKSVVNRILWVSFFFDSKWTLKPHI